MDPAVCGTGVAFDLAAAGRLNAAGLFNTLTNLSGAFGALALGLLAMVGGGTSCSIRLGTALLQMRLPNEAMARPSGPSAKGALVSLPSALQMASMVA